MRHAWWYSAPFASCMRNHKVVGTRVYTQTDINPIPVFFFPNFCYKVFTPKEGSFRFRRRRRNLFRICFVMLIFSLLLVQMHFRFTITRQTNGGGWLVASLCLSYALWMETVDKSPERMMHMAGFVARLVFLWYHRKIRNPRWLCRQYGFHYA